MQAKQIIDILSFLAQMMLGPAVLMIGAVLIVLTGIEPAYPTLSVILFLGWLASVSSYFVQFGSLKLIAAYLTGIVLSPMVMQLYNGKPIASILPGIVYILGVCVASIALTLTLNKKVAEKYNQLVRKNQ